MVKFSDINNDNINSTKPIHKKKGDESEANARLSFRKLAAEQKKVLSTDKVVSERKASDEDQIGESGKEKPLMKTRSVRVGKPFIKKQLLI